MSRSTSSQRKKLKSKRDEITDESEIESDQFRRRQKDWHQLTVEQIEEFKRRDLLDSGNEFRRGETFNHTDHNRLFSWSIDAEARNTKRLTSTLEYIRDINFGDDRKETALHKAADRGHRDIVQLLLWKGAPIEAINKN